MFNKLKRIDEKAGFENAVDCLRRQIESTRQHFSENPEKIMEIGEIFDGIDSVLLDRQRNSIAAKKIRMAIGRGEKTIELADYDTLCIDLV